MPGGGGGGTIPGGDAIIPGGGVGIPDGAIIPGGAIPGGAIPGGVIPGGAIPGGGPIPGGGGGLYPSFPPSPAFGCGAIFIYLFIVLSSKLDYKIYHLSNDFQRSEIKQSAISQE